MITGRNILLIGGAGFIGSSIAEKLANSNSITIFDSGLRTALPYMGLIDNKNVTVVKGDVLDQEKIKKVIPNHDIIVHLAAIAGVRSVITNPALTFTTNFIGTYNVLECVKNMKILRFIDFSTSEVYGPDAENVTEENNTVQGPIGEPRWNYAVSKLASEYLTFSYHKEYGIPTVTVRPFNIYGPKQIGEGGMRSFIINALKKNDLEVHGNGMNVRAWCYIDDMVKAVLAMMEKKQAVGHTFNIGNPNASITNLELAKKIIQITNSSSKIVFKEINYPDVRKRIPDISKAKKLLGFRPNVNLESGIKLTAEWCRDVYLKQTI